MKTRRGKRSEAYWPSIVMKKWLNIKPKAYEFSEDEVDSETESEDDGTPSKGSVRPTKRKSETLRAQCINTKDVRVTVGTWNVAGRPPHEDLEIDEWLCMEEPADVYILGFQEVVPLNAGNVLGSETRRPIPKWQSIIRGTLNKSFELESNHKGYSAPPSPILRTCSAADVVDTSANSNDPESQKMHGVIEMGKKFKFKSTNSIDRYSRLDWPEHPLDITSQGFVSVSMSLFQTRMCFVCSHLTSGHKDGYEQRRNSDGYQILRRTHFSSAFDTDQPLTIPSHEAPLIGGQDGRPSPPCSGTALVKMNDKMMHACCS